MRLYSPVDLTGNLIMIEYKIVYYHLSLVLKLLSDLFFQHFHIETAVYIQLLVYIIIIFLLFLFFFN